LKPLGDLLPALQHLRGSLLPWLDEMDSVVTHRLEAADITSMLLTSLGAEILNAHVAFQQAVDAYREHLAS
jgi:hypothetical protein